MLYILIPVTASEKCHQEKRKTVNGEDILFAMTSLGFENYSEALKIYLAKYREVCKFPGFGMACLLIFVADTSYQRRSATKCHQAR